MKLLTLVAGVVAATLCSVELFRLWEIGSDISFLIGADIALILFNTRLMDDIWNNR